MGHNWIQRGSQQPPAVYARCSEGCSGVVSDTRFTVPDASVPLYTEKYSATAERPSLDSCRAVATHVERKRQTLKPGYHLRGNYWKPRACKRWGAAR
jgi:hypothetical protein